MKIAIGIPLFPPKWFGGAENATCNIARYLTKKGHEVHVITLHNEGLPKDSQMEGFYVHRVASSNIRIFGELILWFEVFKCIKKISPDIIQIQFINYGMPAYISKKLLHIPYCVWGRGTEVYHPWLGKNLISYFVLKNANEVFALTHHMKRAMHHLCNRDIKVIPNGISNTRFKIWSGIKHQDRSFKTLICVAILRPLKGLDYLIEALKIICERYTSTQLIIIGDGDDRKKLETLAHNLGLSDNIAFLGKKPNTEIPKFLAESDIFVFPSLSEGFPNVLLEAMASGLPVVATNISGISEIIKDGENGLLVKPKNSQDLAEKILYLFQNDKLIRKMSENNLKTAKEYNWDIITAQLEEIYYQHINISKV
jgi:glycosyltransferase involved in cell wall biosynthesis